MKAIKTSFLFFCKIIIVVLLLGNNLLAQQSVDSIKYYSDLAENASNAYDATRSFKYFDEQLKLHIDDNNVLGQVSILTSIAQIQNSLGMIYESEGSAVEALKLLDKTPYEPINDRFRLSLYNHLGILYKESKSFSTSIEYYEKALELVGDSIYRITAINNLANVYREKGDFNRAIYLYKGLLKSEILADDSIKMARTLNNLGKTQSIVNDPKAIDNLERALLLRKEKNFDKGIVSSYISLGEHYKRNGDVLKAFDYTKKALPIAESNNRINEKIAIFELQCYLGFFNNYPQLKRLTDSIDNAKRISTNLYAAIRYDNQKAILEKEKEKSMKLLYLIIAILVIFISIFTYYSQSTKHKKDKIKQAYLKETEFSKKVHDELANDVSDLMNYIEDDIDVPNDKKNLLLNNIEDIYLRTRDISTETASIDLANFSKSLSNLLMQHNREGTKVVINNINTINWNKVPDHKKMVVYRCLQELMVNMKKHSKAKLVSIVFKEHNNKKEIRYVDDGLGFSVDETKFNGLANVESRIESIKGSFSFTTSRGNGFKATLKFNS
ncbi:tetratricopeptide repeat protein [Winogradskyella sp. 3972H.M.0a.05]|uniref:tetratricopeptide repeat-containing sensor histidine kinase n=1 Tax=Winogradskyella sp. 3972H.M.0a.05 TaxID=2950277 RepID=UPI0033919452